MGLNYLMISVIAVFAFVSISCDKSDGFLQFSGTAKGPAGGPLSWSPAKWFDAAGNLYIADSGNNAIRKVDSSGNISTVAGTFPTSSGGTSTDGGASATTVALDGPSDFVFDHAANMIIVDYNDVTIRKIIGGLIYLIAGAYGNTTAAGENIAALSATFSYPYGIALDSWGNIYISDTSGGAVRKIDKTTGIITTYAGMLGDSTCSSGGTGEGVPATSACLNAPMGLAFSSSWDLYIADSGSSAIRKVSASTGLITTVAGELNSTGYDDGVSAKNYPTLTYPSGIAVDSSGNLYIADTYNYAVRKVTASTGIISTIAGTLQNNNSGTFAFSTTATNAYFAGPSALSFDSTGNLYIADTGSGSSVIVKVDPSGSMTWVAGTGTAGSTVDGGSTALGSQLNSPFYN